MKFKKGQSGNPGGRPTNTVNGINLSELARTYCPKAIETAAKIMNNDEIQPMARLKACEILMDRGLGKPLQQTELTGKDGERLFPESDDALRARHIELARQIAKSH